MKFKHLDGLRIDHQTTVWYEMPEVCPGAALLVAPMTQSNKPWMNAALRKSGNRPTGKKSKLSIETIDTNRLDDIELMPRFIVRGWRNILDENDQEVPFNAQNARELLEALPDWMVDDLRKFASDPMNFISAEDDAAPVPEELVGNDSEPGSSGTSDTPETAG